MKKILRHIILTVLVAGSLFPLAANAARTSIDWVNQSGTTYIQPNFSPSGVDLLVQGSNHYINFNALTGSSGYGFRDNNGSMEFKNSGGSWTGIGSGGGGGGGVATTSLTATYPIKATVSSATINFSLLDMATTTATCSGTVSCSSFVIIGSSPITITGSAASSTLLSDNNTFSGNNTFTQITNFNNGLLSTASSTFTGNLTLATTTTGSLNGTIVVSGFPYPQNTTGINEALSQCGVNGIKGVFFTFGSYSVTAPINIPSNCDFYGAGVGKTIFTDGSGGVLNQFFNVSTTTNSSMHDFSILGNGSTIPTGIGPADGIDDTASTKLTFYNIGLSHLNDAGINVQSSGAVAASSTDIYNIYSDCTVAAPIYISNDTVQTPVSDTMIHNIPNLCGNDSAIALFNSTTTKLWAINIDKTGTIAGQGLEIGSQGAHSNVQDVEAWGITAVGAFQSGISVAGTTTTGYVNDSKASYNGASGFNLNAAHFTFKGDTSSYNQQDGFRIIAGNSSIVSAPILSNDYAIDDNQSGASYCGMELNAQSSGSIIGAQITTNTFLDDQATTSPQYGLCFVNTGTENGAHNITGNVFSGNAQSIYFTPGQTFVQSTMFNNPGATSTNEYLNINGSASTTLLSAYHAFFDYFSATSTTATSTVLNLNVGRIQNQSNAASAVLVNQLNTEGALDVESNGSAGISVPLVNIKQINGSDTGNAVQITGNSAANQAALLVQNSGTAALPSGAYEMLVQNTNSTDKQGGILLNLKVTGNQSSGIDTLVTNGGLAGFGTTTPWGFLSLAPASTTLPMLVDWFQGSSSPAFIIGSANQNGNVGIATTTPGSTFSIGGIVNFTTATSTFYSTGGINLAAGCYAIGGNCLSLGNISGVLGIANGGTATTTGGNSNALEFYNGTTLTNNSHLQTILDSTGNWLNIPYQSSGQTNGVQIGLGDYNSYLWQDYAQLNDTLRISANYYVNNSGSGVINNVSFPTEMIQMGYKAAAGSGGADPNGGIDFETGGAVNTNPSIRIDITDAGLVGIASSTPWGQLSLSPGVSASTTPQFISWVNGSSTPSFIISSANNNGNIGIGTTTPGSLLSLAGTTGILASTTATSTFIGGGINLITGAGNTGCFAVNGTCIGGSGGSGTVTSITAATPNSTLTLGGTNPVTTSGTINFDLNLTHSNWWTATQNFTNASTSLFEATSSARFSFLSGISAGSFLAVDPNGYLVSTTTPINTGGATEGVQWATAAILAGTPTYSNGSSGVGATLTEIGNGALSVDGNNPALGDRVLVKNQASAFQNGIYSVTQAGSAIAVYILTRTSDYNTPTEITPGLTTYVVSGTANTDTTWAVSYTAPLTIGTTNLNYTSVSGGGAAVASVSNSDGTLTISPTSGNVVASLALAHANTWTASTTYQQHLNLQDATTTTLGTAVFYNTGITSALASFDANHKESSYAGSGNPCATNQAPTTISAVGALGGCTSTFLTTAVTSVAANNGITGGTITTTGTLSLDETFGGVNTAASSTWTGHVALNTASSTQFSSATMWNSTVGNAVWLGDANGKATAATTQTCTNQFMRAMSAAYSVTCNTVSLTADVTGTLPVGNGGTGATSYTAGQILYGDGTLALGSNSSFFYSTSTGSLVDGTTTPALGALTVGTSTAPQINLWDNLAGDIGWAFRSAGGSLYIATSTATATSSTSAISISNNGIASMNIGSTTNSLSAVNGMLTLGGNGANGASGSSTVEESKMQWDGYNSAGTRVCMYVVGTTLTIGTGACTP